MGRPNYVCTICSQHFSRRFSAKRHNSNLHNSGAEIVPYIEYMAGRSSGKYAEDYPTWDNKRSGFRGNQSGLGRRSLADPGTQFRPPNFQQPFPLPKGMAYSTNPTPFRPPNFQQRSPTEEKLEEFRLLLSKYASPAEASAFFRCAKIQLDQGDDRLLNDLLDQLRMRDTLG